MIVTAVAVAVVAMIVGMSVVAIVRIRVAVVTVIRIRRTVVAVIRPGAVIAISGDANADADVDARVCLSRTAEADEAQDCQ